MRAILTLSVLAILGLGATAAPAPKETKKSLVEKLSGEWRMTKSDAPAGVPKGYTFTVHYLKDGVLEFHQQVPDQEDSVQKGKYTTTDSDEKNPLGTIDWTIGEDGASRGEISKIIKLSEDELVFEDPDGVQETFVRVKVEKKKEKDEKKKDEKKEKKDKKDDQ